MDRFRAMEDAPEPTDEDLVRRVADGADDALGLLYRRWARPVLAMAIQSLGRSGAEDVVQEVFVTVWRNASRFDPARGSFRAWVLQIAHYRILNELRHRSRQPRLDADADGAALGQIPDREPGPAESASREERRSVVRAALAALPAAEREALRLAMLQDLTHEEVARELGLPLGTAKTRIRTGLRRLRTTLLPQAAALAMIALFAILYRGDHTRLARNERALTLVTASDAENLRLAPAPGVPAATHARYRGRAGTPLAVVTFSAFPPAAAGETYQVWVRHAATWTSLGTVDARTERIVVESDVVAALPDAVQVTREPAGGSRTPTGPVVVAWER